MFGSNGIEYTLLLANLLTPREFKIISFRYGLLGEKEHTLEETAKEFDVGPARVRQIEAKALRKLKKAGVQ